MIQRTFVLLLPLLLTLCIGTRGVAQNQPGDAFEAMFDRMSEQMMDQFGDQAGPMGAFFGKLTPEQLAKLEQVQISVAEERQFGESVVDEFSKQCRRDNVTLIRVGKEVDYLKRLCAQIKPLIKNSDRYRALDVVLIDVDSENAYSVPGGTVLVTRGLLEKANSEAALVGVLSHELSHLDRGHQLLMLKQSKLAQQPLGVKDRMLLIGLVARPFRPEQESDADADATGWMMQLGYEPKELSRLLDRWDRQQEQTMPWQKFVPGFVKSHPDAGKRALEVLEIANEQRNRHPRANYLGQQNLKRRIPKSVREWR